MMITPRPRGDMEIQRPKKMQMVVGDLDEDSLVEVLVRLPCKYVMRLKLVCKRWMSLISDPAFIRYYMNLHHIPRSLSSTTSIISKKLLPLQHQNQCWSLIVLAPYSTWKGEKEVRFLAGRGCSSNNNVFKPGLSFLPRAEQPNQSLFVAGSFNDLVLCSRRRSGDFSSDVDVVYYYICNPLTMQFVALPPPPPSAAYCRTSVGFVCEPFFKDGDLNYDYRCRVVRLPYVASTSPPPLELEIFSSETGSWTKNKLTLSSSPVPGLSLPSFAHKLVPYRNGRMMLFLKKHAIKFDPFAANGNNDDKDIIKGHLVGLPESFYLDQTYCFNNSVITNQGRLFLVELLFHSYPLRDRTPPYLKVWEYIDDDEDGGQQQQQQQGQGGRWKLVDHIPFSEMKAPTTAALSIKEMMRMVSRESPYSKHHRRTWLGNFFKCLVLCSQHGVRAHTVTCVGFHLTRPNVIYLILSPPEPALAALAAYNMQTGAVKLVPKSRVPPHLRCLQGHASHDIFPFVAQPWPTPLPPQLPCP